MGKFAVLSQNVKNQLDGGKLKHYYGRINWNVAEHFV